MKVGIFYNSISNPGKFSNKVMLMDNFAAGVVSAGDEVIEYRNNMLPDQQMDAGFVLGYTLEDNFRKKIIDSLRSQKSHRIFVDSNILHYARPEHEWHRYSLDSVYPNSGVYFFGALDATRWQHYGGWHGVQLKDWRIGNNNQHILILCQRPKGWNMFGNDQNTWLDKTIDKIRKFEPKRIIRIRMHPGDGTKAKQIEKIQKQYGQKTDRIKISAADNIRQDLENCWCTVGYNSTPNVVARIEGVPGYIEDARHSWAADVSFDSLEQIVNPPLPDRNQWIHRVANIHWSNQKVASGELWGAIRSYIEHSR